jgi:nitrous oxidase accessory protein NosD
MEKIKTVLCGLLLFGVFLWALPSAEAVMINVDCDTGGVLQTAINAASPGDIISVTGTCNENVTIPPPKTALTLDGGGTATIKGPNLTKTTITVLGRVITIKRFTISGGYDGIQVVLNASATIDNNTIDICNNGIIVAAGSYASIINNTISNNLARVYHPRDRDLYLNQSWWG